MRGAEWRVASPDPKQMTAWRQMRQALWPEMTEAENLHETEAMMMMATSRFFVRIALNTQDNPIGFVEATLRTDYVNRCATSPVAFFGGNLCGAGGSETRDCPCSGRCRRRMGPEDGLS
jgi:hypothetical protein